MTTNGHSNAEGPEWELDFRDHFLYFPEKSNADIAAERLRAKGWIVKVSRSAGYEDWLVFATEHWPKEEEFESQRQELERLAEDLGGVYDGWGGPG